jgi:CBS-domain-containing membrane protein
VLIYGAIESPLAQPRAVIGGQVISAILGVAITRLFALDSSYIPALDNQAFHYGTFINGALSMSVALLAMFLTSTLHPPGGATALIAATSIEAARMSWSYIALILVSTLLMVAWALIINNIGRRRYPIYWWSPERTFVIDDAPATREDEEIALGTGRDSVLRRAEDGGRTAEALAEERLEGHGGSPEQIQRALSRASRDSRAYERGRKGGLEK